MSDNVIVISHSEVESYLSCNMKHYYAFGDDSLGGPKKGLEPKRFSDALFRGITGHEALGTFYQAIKDGKTLDEAAHASVMTLQAIAIRPEVLTHATHLNIVSDLQGRILPRYFEQGAKPLLAEGWRPEYVEQTFRLELPYEDFRLVYPFKPDVVMLDATGNRWVWDHKFLYNFYSSDDINLLPQIPKYIGALRATGLHVKGGYYNQLRWREVKDFSAHVRTDKFIPTDARVKNAFRQQYDVMVEIAKRKLATNEEWHSSSRRVLSTMVCKSCSFKYLCTQELNGTDATLTKRVEFLPNSYGYSAESE